MLLLDGGDKLGVAGPVTGRKKRLQVRDCDEAGNIYVITINWHMY